MSNTTSMAPTRLAKKEVFLGDVQQPNRLCAPLHCSFVLEPLSEFGQWPERVVVKFLKERFSPTSEMPVHMALREKIVDSFTDHESAIDALRVTKQGDYLHFLFSN